MFHLYDKIMSGQTYFIAEMSANHGGNLDNALEIVRQAKAAGADCLKIQTYNADTMTLNCNNADFLISGGLWDGFNLYKLYDYAGTPYEWHKTIKNECEKVGIDFLSTPFDKSSVDFLEGLGIEAYKVASYELVDIPLISYIASKHKPMIISVGMGNIEEIQDCIDACRAVGNEQIVLLKCCSEYPAPWADMKLGNIPDMRERFGCPVGLSDHSYGSLGAIVGVTLGACVVEKHVKLEGVKSADSEFSMSMQDFSSMIEECKNAKLIASGPDYSLSASEQASTAFRRSIYAASDIKAGEEFSSVNVRIIRPGYGMKPKFYDCIIGKVAKRDIRFGDRIISEDIDKTILEKFFLTDMEYLYKVGKKYKCLTGRFKQMLNKYGGVETVKRLINSKVTPEKLKKLAELNKYGISVETYVLRQEYEALFTEDEREKCRENLRRSGCSL